MIGIFSSELSMQNCGVCVYLCAAGQQRTSVTESMWQAGGCVCVWGGIYMSVGLQCAMMTAVAP